MNNFKVDGITRARTRQLYILCVLGFSLGLLVFLVVLSFSLVFLLNREFPISPFWGPPGVRSAPGDFSEQVPGCLPVASLSFTRGNRYTWVWSLERPKRSLV